MTKKWAAVAAVLGLATLAAVSCRQSMTRTLVLHVPQMGDERGVRIVTNALLDQVVGRLDGIQHQYEIDLAKKLVLFHEGPRVLSADFQRQVRTCLRDVGFEATVTSAGYNPPALVPTADGLRQAWPGRHTLVLSVPDMKTATQANIVVGAIAYARIGRDDSRVRADRQARTVRVVYDAVTACRLNLEHSVAGAGYGANAVPANLGRPDALPNGWTPVAL